MLQIFNSLTQTKEPFKPLKPGAVSMYVCGITVYDHCHIGHARAVVAFDVIYRYLQAAGFDVTYVRNITDIDDKIIKRAAERHEDIVTMTEYFIREMYADFDALGVLRPKIEPRATENIQNIIDMISTLVKKGHAYQGATGDVYYAVDSFEGYGKLSHRKLDDMRAGERVEVNTDKRNPLDFVLWKQAKPQEPSWASPWGPGRPGWHIECSAMATRCLGETFDIHGGGFDLQFPHHENEIAQSEGATGKTFANTWMHVGFVNIDDEKMSKSLNNFFTIREVLADYDADTLRFFLLSSHYRSAINYSLETLAKARASLMRLYTALRGRSTLVSYVDEDFAKAFHAAMKDDFNTPVALAVLFDVAREINRVKELDPARADQLATTLIHLGGILGILEKDPEVFLRGTADDQEHEAEEIHELIVARNRARMSKDFALSDKIRDDLLARGIILEDAAGVTTWRRR